MNINLKALVIGSSPQCLFFLRQLSHAGYEVELISSSKKVAWFSRYGTKHYAHKKNDILKILEKFKSKVTKIPCYIGGGSELQYICEHYPNIFTDFDVYPKPLKAIELFLDKKKTYAYVKRHNINITNTISAKEYKNNSSEIELQFPVILKCNIELNSEEIDLKFKTKVFNKRSQVICFLENLDDTILDKLIIQHYIQHGKNVSMLGYYDHGRLLNYMIVHQIRQHPEGITSYLKEVSQYEKKYYIERISPVMNDLNYTGFAEFEFKIDSHNTPFLLEVNPRPCGWTSAFEGKFGSIEKLLENTCKQKNSIPVKKDNVEWFNSARDLLAIISQLRKTRNISIFLTQLLTFFTIKQEDVFKLNDPNPFFSQFLNLK